MNLYITPKSELSFGSPFSHSKVSGVDQVIEEEPLRNIEIQRFLELSTINLY